MQSQLKESLWFIVPVVLIGGTFALVSLKAIWALDAY
jgi:hypothetical protein